jgi:hypothetical protein
MFGLDPDFQGHFGIEKWTQVTRSHGLPDEVVVDLSKGCDIAVGHSRI